MAVLATTVTILGCLVAIVAAWYAYGPYKAQRELRDRHRFVEARRHLGRNRPQLTSDALEAQKSWEDSNFPGMLSDPVWILPRPVSLQSVQIDLSWNDLVGTNSEPIARYARRLLPRGESGNNISSYSDALDQLARPSLFENRLCYRLIRANLTATPPTMRVGLSRYFDSVNETEALAHEVAELDMGGSKKYHACALISDHQRTFIHATQYFLYLLQLFVSTEANRVFCYIREKMPTSRLRATWFTSRRLVFFSQPAMTMPRSFGICLYG